MFQGFRLCCVLIWLFAASLVQGQSYSSTQYKIEDGLPSNEVFWVLQGQQGYIWASTDKGIVRYDGKTFKAYGIENGLRSTVIYKILASPLGGVAFYDVDNRIGIIRNDSILYFLNDTSVYIRDARSSNKGLVICLKDTSCYHVYSWNGKKRLQQCYPTGAYLINDKEMGLISVGKFIDHPSDGTFIASDGSRIPGEKLFFNFSHISWHEKHKDKVILACNAQIAILHPDASIVYKNLPAKATSGGFIDFDGRLWMGLHSGGVKVISLEEKGPDRHLLDGYSVSSICKDDEGNIWLGTLRNGIIRLSESFFQPVLKGPIEKTILFNHQLVAASSRPSLLLSDINTGANKEVETDFRISDLIQIDDHLIVSTSHESDLVPPLENMIYMGMMFSKMTHLQNQPASVTRNLLGIRNIGEEIKLYPLQTIGFGYTYVTQNFDDTIYVGRSAGLFKVYEKDGQFLVNKVLSIPATTLLKTQEGFVVGTKGKGLVFTDSHFSVKKRYSTKNGLCGDFISSMELVGDMLICGTANGISFVTKIYTPSQTQISSYHVSNGLWSSNITDLTVHNNELFVATDKGVQKTVLSQGYHNTANPRPIINLLSKARITSKKPLKIEPGTKVIKVDLATIFFHDHKNYLREYRLLGSDSVWVTSSSSELEFLNLTPGKYELQFRTKLYENDYYSSTSLQFELLPLFSQTIWFKVGIVLLVLFTLLLLWYFRERQMKERNGMILLQEQLRYKALASQLNPHFMFNALGSVQNLIITKKNDKAAEYLASFSGLLSKTLRNTNELFIPLRDEMAFINEYVEIEKFRFEKPITFNWHISEQIKPRETLVPTMFLQPYVENAIIHGINPSTKMGEIDISIERVGQRVLEIKIRDNGIGIEVARVKRSKRARKSMAMENIQTRIKTMAKLYKNTFRHQATQVVDDHGAIRGTEVILDIPYKVR